MFGLLTEKLGGAFSKLSGQRKLTEDNISDAVREVRLALLEADVNYAVVKNFIKRVKEKALGDAVVKSVSPQQQFVKIIHDELVSLMGGEEPQLNLSAKPAVVMMCGLQGSGKTTHSAKLVHHLKKAGKCNNPLLVACDLQRPAAIQQLQTLGDQVGVPVFVMEGEKSPVKVAKAAMTLAGDAGHDLVVIDTAGRLHVDEEMMQQLEKVKSTVKPHEVLFVANATTGQDAVKTAATFNERVEITGTILTMLDGNTRGGAAISIREVTGKPLVFEGIGEKMDDLQWFNPQSMADRILGMGDTINLVKKAQEHIDEKDAEALEKKIRKASFTYNDYLSQMQMVKKMGSLKSILKMLPGASKLGDLDIDDKEFFKVEAIILSMTPQEREQNCEMAMGRRKRVARGSGTSLDDVNRLVKSFKQAKQFMKNMPKMKNLEKMMGGAL